MGKADEFTTAAGRVLASFTSLAQGQVELNGPPASGRTSTALTAAIAAAEAGRTVVYVCAFPYVLDATLHMVPKRLRTTSPTAGAICAVLADERDLHTLTQFAGTYVVLDDADWYPRPRMKPTFTLIVTQPGDTPHTPGAVFRAGGPGGRAADDHWGTLTLGAPLRGGPDIVDALQHAGISQPVNDEEDDPDSNRASPRPSGEPSAGQIRTALTSPGVTLLEVPVPSEAAGGQDSYILDQVAETTVRLRPGKGDPIPDDTFLFVTSSEDADQLDWRLDLLAPLVRPVPDTLGQAYRRTVVPATKRLLESPRELTVALTRHTRTCAIVTSADTRHPVLDRLRDQGRSMRWEQ